MRKRAPVVLSLSRIVTARKSEIWAALTTPALMQRWMLVPASVVPDAPLEIGSRIEWYGDDQEPYLIGKVTTCQFENCLAVQLQDRSWPRLARNGEVTWSFKLKELAGGTRVDYRLGDLAIDPEADAWYAAYLDADEPERLAAVVRELVS